jgi:hypothetical protein
MNSGALKDACTCDWHAMVGLAPYSLKILGQKCAWKVCKMLQPQAKVASLRTSCVRHESTSSQRTSSQTIAQICTLEVSQPLSFLNSLLSCKGSTAQSQVRDRLSAGSPSAAGIRLDREQLLAFVSEIELGPY